MLIRTVLTVTLLCVAPALAQTAIQTAAPAPTANENPGPQVEKRIADLRNKLQISPAQDPLWTVFASTMRQNAVHVRQMSAARVTQAGAQKAPDEMRGYADAARTHAEDLARLVAPFEALYATMSPEQQANADRAFDRPVGRSKR